jgi:hypothetical protein
MASTKLLLFHLEPRLSHELIEGRLLAINTEQASLDNQFIATSGVPGSQSWDAQFEPGRGLIPRQDLSAIAHYQVQTNPIPLPTTKGVEGNFYKIDPHWVRVGKVQRGDFGIHFDANVPGSAGCIVIRNRPAWVEFEALIKGYRGSGLNSVPLLVSYAR